MQATLQPAATASPLVTVTATLAMASPSVVRHIIAHQAVAVLLLDHLYNSTLLWQPTKCGTIIIL